jgi:signal peptidase II
MNEPNDPRDPEQSPAEGTAPGASTAEAARQPEPETSPLGTTSETMAVSGAEGEPMAASGAEGAPMAAADAEGEPVAVSGAEAAATGEAPASPPGVGAEAPSLDEAEGKRPTFVFFGIVAGLTLLADVVSKAWAEIYFHSNLVGHSVELVEDHLSFVLAYNKGGAWGLAHDASDAFRRPFFLIVSVLAIAFIVSLYNRLSPKQHALKWGLPLVLGGALGNLVDRIVRSQVIDFIDYRADWVRSMNEWIARNVAQSWSITDHWPTFNVADVAICVGVGLMAVDMLTSRRGHAGAGTAATGSGATATEPASPEPAKSEPASPEPAKSEPASPEPASPEPSAQATPGRAGDEPTMDRTAGRS